VSRVEIGRTLEGLRTAGRALRRRPAAEVLRVVGGVLDAWSDPGSDARRALAALHPPASGLSPETVEAGLDLALAGWDADALRELVACELGSVEALQGACGPSVVAMVHGGVIPMPTLLDLLLPLLLRSPVLSKPAARDPVTPRLVMESLAEADPELAACVALADFRRDDAAALAALCDADRVVVTGSDTAVDAVAARVPPERLVAHGHGLSVAVLGSDAEDLDEAAQRLAVDVALWDQLGCLSPIAVYVLDAGDAVPRVRPAVRRTRGARVDAFAAALAEALGRRERDWPRGEIDPASAAQVAAERAAAEMRAAAGAPVALHAGPGTSWTVVREADAAPRPAPLHRFVRVHPVPDLAALDDALAPLARHLTGVATWGLGDGATDLETRLRALGASRVAPFGTLQAPPLAWRRGGHPLLQP